MNHHTPEFIEEMQQQLLQEKATLAGELGSLAHKEDEDYPGQYEANFPDYGRDDESNASEMADYEARNTATVEAEGRLEEVKAALERIEEGSYGVTAEGELIPENRLRANPAATTLVKK